MSSNQSKPFALFLSAHCDDAEFWAGGTICRYITSGWVVIIAILCHDAKRREEAKKSAKILGCQVIFWDANHSTEDWILELIKEYRPTVFFTHQKEDPHFEHNALFDSTLVALTRFRERKKCPLRWYTFDSYYLSKIPAGCPILIDITDHFDKKCAALRCHSSQNPEQLVERVRHMNALHGQKIRVDFAEAFYPFSLLGRWPRLRDLP